MPTADYILIDGVHYSKYHPKVLAHDKTKTTHNKPVARLDSPKPKYHPPQPLVGDAQTQNGGHQSLGQISVLIVRHGSKRLDSDNLAFAHKFLRDAIAERLSIDDGDPRITWTYEQIISKTRGTHVLITATP